MRATTPAPESETRLSCPASRGMPRMPSCVRAGGGEPYRLGDGAVVSALGRRRPAPAGARRHGGGARRRPRAGPPPLAHGGLASLERRGAPGGGDGLASSTAGEGGADAPICARISMGFP